MINDHLIPHHPQPQEMAALTAKVITVGAETLLQAANVENGVQAQAVWEEMIGEGETAILQTAVSPNPISFQIFPFYRHNNSHSSPSQK